jgi:hypothetical protein
MDINTIEFDNNEFTKKDHKKNNYKIDKMTILLILILISFYDKLSFIIWDIGKSLIYIVIFLFGLSYLNKPFADNIKNVIYEIINIGSNNFIKDTASSVSNGISNLIKSSKIESNNINYDIDNSRNLNNDSSSSVNRTLSNNNINNIRKLDR